MQPQLIALNTPWTRQKELKTLKINNWFLSNKKFSKWKNSNLRSNLNNNSSKWNHQWNKRKEKLLSFKEWKMSFQILFSRRTKVLPNSKSKILKNWEINLKNSKKKLNKLSKSSRNKIVTRSTLVKSTNWKRSLKKLTDRLRSREHWMKRDSRNRLRNYRKRWFFKKKTWKSREEDQYLTQSKGLIILRMPRKSMRPMLFA